jgi:hypothetical protein
MMNCSAKFQYPPLGISSKNLIPHHDSDLQPLKQFQRRKPKTPRTRLKKYGTSGSGSGKRSRPETPLLKWKIHDKTEDLVDEEKKSSSSPVKVSRRVNRNVKKQMEVTVSVRRLAAGLWRLHQPEMVVDDSQKRFGLGFQVMLNFFFLFNFVLLVSCLRSIVFFIFMCVLFLISKFDF